MFRLKDCGNVNRLLRLLALAAVLIIVPQARLQAQNLRDIFGGGAPDPIGGSSEATITLNPANAKDGDVVTLKIAVTIPPGSHTYSQSKKFVGNTVIKLKTPAGITAVDSTFKPDHKPKSKFDENFKQTVEVFEDDVSWTRRFKVGPQASGRITFDGQIDYQVCDTECTPYHKEFALHLDVEGKEPVFEARSRKPPAGRPETSVWHVRLSPPDAKPGDTVKLSVEAKLKKGFHTFAVDQNPDNVGLPPDFRILAVTGLEPADENGFTTDKEVEDYKTDKGIPQRVHHDEVTWSRDYVVTESGKDGYGIAGKVTYQVCDDTTCRRNKVEFNLGTVNAEDWPVEELEGPSEEGEKKVADLGVFKDLSIRNRTPEGDTKGTLGTYLLYAFLGGLILNVMPCVLPVIAIKVLSFVQQAGEDRGRILTLNLVYSAGVVSVFLVLASLAVFAGLGWGNQFQNTGFNIGMTIFVFVMALSLLDVFEIPIPGMVGSAGGEQKEGLSGAFMTGIFATILATPCSGPFLGTALAWSVKQPPTIIYLTWLTMGVGMASPYLVFGMFPGAVKYLPRPGNWMVRFKQFAGFVLLGTTIYLLSILEKAGMIIPSLVMLLGVGIGLWMIGSMYNLASPKAWRWKVRITALVVAGCICGLGYRMTLPGHTLPWQKFSQEAVAESLQEGKPVMIDFTAAWCATCITLEETTLNIESTKRVVEENDVVVLKADWTNHSQEIRDVLESVGQDAIPTLVIFSPNRPKEPIVMHGLWTTSLLHEELGTVIAETKGTTTGKAGDQRQAALTVPAR